MPTHYDFRIVHDPSLSEWKPWSVQVRWRGEYHTAIGRWLLYFGFIKNDWLPVHDAKTCEECGAWIAYYVEGRMRPWAGDENV
jgi:hypothetical protein